MTHFFFQFSILLILKLKDPSVDKIMDANGNTALLLAVCKKDLKEVQSLIRKGANINAANKEGFTVLFFACMYNHSEIIKYLIENGANVKTIDNFGNTVLHQAGLCSLDFEIFKYLIEEGVNINAANKSTCVILSSACGDGDLLKVKYLVEKGANIDFVGVSPPFSAAACKGRFEVVKYLVENGANINLASSMAGDTALHWAVLVDMPRLSNT